MTNNTKCKTPKQILDEYHRVSKRIEKTEGSIHYDRDSQEYDIGYCSGLAWVLGAGKNQHD